MHYFRQIFGNINYFSYICAQKTTDYFWNKCNFTLLKNWNKCNFIPFQKQKIYYIMFFQLDARLPKEDLYF